MSLNVATDLSFFGMIVPCGLEHKRHVTSLAAEVAERIQMDQVASRRTRAPSSPAVLVLARKDGRALPHTALLGPSIAGDERV